MNVKLEKVAFFWNFGGGFATRKTSESDRRDECGQKVRALAGVVGAIRISSQDVI
jgi:hypothetical protein